MSIESFAGGSHWEGKVTSFERHDDSYSFSIKFSSNEIHLPSGCGMITVNYRYGRVPWYSWLPFIHSSHPSKAQSEEAVDYIEEHFKMKKSIYFGYMGGGLVPLENKCVFKTKGLIKVNIEKIISILAFHDPV